MILHTVNKSPFSDNTLAQCLARASEKDAIVLLDDGVYSILAKHNCSQGIQQLSACYAISDDVAARGLDSLAQLPNIQLIHYDDFVELATQFDIVQSWY